MNPPIPALSQRAMTAAGLVVSVRTVRPDDRERLRRSMSRLSALSRYQRFFTPVEELSGEQLERFTHPDGRSHIALAAVVDDPEEPGGERIVGVARVIGAPAAESPAEISIVVGDAFQRQGIGRLLLHLLVDTAHAAGHHRLAAFVLGENHAMLTLFRQVGGRLAFDSARGVVSVDLPLDEARPAA